MTSLQIKNHDLYKGILALPNTDRGKFFEKYSKDIEKELGVSLVKHSYRDLSQLESANCMISYQENFGSRTGELIGIMEFVPKS